MSKENKDQLLKVEIKDNLLTISIGIETLVETCGQDYLDQFSEHQVTDYSVLAKEIKNELIDEEEDGTTLIHKAFDEAVENVIEKRLWRNRNKGLIYE